MVRKITSTEERRDHAQWLSAWEMLSGPHRAIIVAFCMRADLDVAHAALRGVL